MTESASSSSVSTGTLSILIHPLVVMSIADHHTRTLHQPMNDLHKKLLSSGRTPRVFGLLFGTQDGRTVNVSETVEAAYAISATTSAIEFQFDALENDVKLFSASYPNYECLGWYATNSGAIVDSSDIHTHRLMTKYNERPLYLLLDTSSRSTRGELPLTLYEETIHVLNEQTTSELVRTSFTINADEGERITSFHCAKLIQKAENDSEISPHLLTLQKSVTSLHERLTTMMTFLVATQNGSIPKNHALLREIKSLIQRLPVGSDTAIRAANHRELNDGLMLTQLAMLTQTMESLKHVNERFAIMKGNHTQRQPGGRRHRGGVMGMLGFGMSDD